MRKEVIYMKNIEVTMTNKHSVDKCIYILLASLLGGFGVHKFYAKRYFLGFIYLIFAWSGIPGVIGIIEGILARLKPRDEHGRINA